MALQGRQQACRTTLARASNLHLFVVCFVVIPVALLVVVKTRRSSFGYLILPFQRLHHFVVCLGRRNYLMV
jgi:hypothetical protein